MIKPDEYGAGDLIHMRVPGNYLRGHDRERGVLAAARHHLKMANYHNFHDLKAAFGYYDKVRRIFETGRYIVLKDIHIKGNRKVKSESY